MIRNLFKSAFLEIGKMDFLLNSITCSTIITHPTCSTSTWSIRMLTCVRFTVRWTFPWTVCTEISFSTSWGKNKNTIYHNQKKRALLTACNTIGLCGLKRVQLSTFSYLKMIVALLFFFFIGNGGVIVWVFFFCFQP